MRFYANLAINSVLDFLSSSKCLACRSRYAEPVCEECSGALVISFRQSVKPIETGSKIFFATYYKDRARKLMRLFKYLLFNPKLKNKLISLRSLAKLWGELLASYWLKNQEYIYKTSNAKIYISSIPLSEGRRQERLYNQTELIAKYFYKKLKKKSKQCILLKDFLLRAKESPGLYKKTREERIEIVKDAFAINPHFVSSQIDKEAKNILLIIDDITTTGSTLLEAHKVSQEANLFDEIILLACTGNTY